MYCLLPLLVFILVWQAVSESGVVNRTLFPPASEVFLAIVELIKSGELLVHVKSSIWRVILGLTLGSLAGTTFGLLTGRIKFFEESFSPIFQVFRSFPPVAVIPLVIVWLGIGEIAKLFSISFAVFFPVWVNTHIGASQIPVHFLQAARTLTNSVLKKWLKVILPASMPFIVAGMRNGVAVAFIMVFVSELAGSSNGLGYLMSVSQLTYRMDNLIAGLLVLGLLGALTDYCFVKFTRRLFPWIGKTQS